MLHHLRTAAAVAAVAAGAGKGAALHEGGSARACSIPAGKGAELWCGELATRLATRAARWTQLTGLAM